MRTVIFSAIVASALLVTFGVSSSVTIFSPSRLAASTVTDLHQPVRIGVASQVLRQMP
jgi:hypothetical protein